MTETPEPTMEDFQREGQRMTLWREVAVAVSRAENSYDPSAPISWANRILDAFDARFPKK